MTRTALSLAFALAAGLLAARADDPPKPADPKPAPNVVTAPEGWKFVKGADKSHAFLIPKAAKSERSEEGSFKQQGFSGKTQAYSAVLPDGKEFTVVQMNLGGPATKDMKISDVYDLIYDADKEGKGVKISEPKEVQVGKRKGVEYFVTDKGKTRRTVVVVVRGRVIQLTAEALKRDQLAAKECDTFLTSLILFDTTPKKADPAAKDKEKDKE